MKPVVAISRIYTDCLDVAAAPAAVFPLLCPVREYDWIEHWRCELLHSHSGVAEDGCIFRTEFEDGHMTWVVTRYEPDRRIEFTCFVPDQLVMRLRIDLQPSPGGGTLTHWTREYVATSDAGAMWVASHDEASYRERMRHLQKALSHYLLTGTRLEASAPAAEDAR
jgi:hypothetical protein